MGARGWGVGKMTGKNWRNNQIKPIKDLQRVGVQQ